MKKILFMLAFVVTLCGCGNDDEEIASSKKDGNSDSNISLMTIEGPCVVAENGSFLVVSDRGEPIVMISEDKSVFNDLTTGDTVKIQCEYVMETYPAQTYITDLEFVKNGEITDVPADVLENLEELGWVAVLE